MSLPVTTFPSVVARFYAPSDVRTPDGMKAERIRSVDSWRGGPRRFDTVFIKDHPGADTISSGLSVARVHCFFSFSFQDQEHACALIRKYRYLKMQPDENTGMWMVRPCFRGAHPDFHIIPLSSIYRAAHLLPHFKEGLTVPRGSSSTTTLDTFLTFYVNRYIDHHAFETAR
jgi:hypothetical protein